ncbi:hypothetical protein KKA15_01535 [Patescibacteria group bacterium]|nr:hypothetical protein [Patescibacteria group bacterium]
MPNKKQSQAKYLLLMVIKVRLRLRTGETSVVVETRLDSPLGFVFGEAGDVRTKLSTLIQKLSLFFNNSADFSIPTL